MQERLIFHVDINSAFLSWEATRRVANGEADLRLIPSVIGGDPSRRTSIVTAKSIPAKKYGIQTGEPVSMAIRKCPNLVVAQGDFELYVKCSHAFKAICQEYTPVMESFSIDEVFLDMTGMGMIYPDPVKTAHEIKDRIRNELGFTANVGIGKCKLCAKMASDFEKPDRVHTLFPEEIERKMWILPVGELFTCGRSSAKQLIANGIKTIGDLAQTDVDFLKTIVGENNAIHLHNYANGIDDSEVKNTAEEAKGYSAETTFDENLTELESIEKILMAQADVVCARIRLENAKCGCVAIKFRTDDFKNHSHQRKLENVTDTTEIVYKTAISLMKESWKGEPIRLVGLSLTAIDRDGIEQLSFFTDERYEKMKKLDKAMDSIRGRFGDGSVKRASTIDVEGRINRRHKANLKHKQNNNIDN